MKNIFTSILSLTVKMIFDDSRVRFDN